MATALNQRLKQESFESSHEEALLNLLVAADHVSSKLREVMKRFDITPAQYNVLRILRGAGRAGHMRCAIAARMIDRSPDVTRLLDRLEEASYAERFAGQEDRRASMARITPRGVKLLEKMDGPVREAGRLLARRWSEAERRKLSGLLEALYSDSRSL